jgi:peptidyl-dipeptidase A
MFLPVAYVFDKYRWELFRGNIKESEYNCKFWKLREEMNGVSPPVARTEKDFDAPAKYHITSNTEYLRYFVSYIIQFQFHKALCLRANEYDPNDPKKPLDSCDIYQSTAAGNALKEMLSMGSSKPWPEAMQVLTGEPKMDITALLEYFKPLEKWLVEFNTKNGVHVGWSPSGSQSFLVSKLQIQ